MKQFRFLYEKTCLIEKNELEPISEKLKPEIRKIKNELEKAYNSNYGFAHVPSDRYNLNVVQELASKKLSLSPTVLIVIGIGGSNLGTIAVHEAINGKLYNNKDTKLKVYFADTVDSDYISEIYAIAEKQLRSYNNIIVNVISKSGTTTETIAIFEIFLNLLKKYKFEKFNEFIVITTDKNSALWNYAQEIDCSILEIPKNVGGRYSVLTSVGLFPLTLLKIDNNQLLDGAQNIISSCLDSENILNNPAAINAAILYYYYKKGIHINDIFLFSIDLEGLGKWFRQLMAESIGKENDLNNQKVEISLTPTVSIGSTDLHSLAQLYLGGHVDRFTDFVTVETNKTNLKTPKIDEFEKIVPNITNIEFKKIMDAIIQGIQTAYTKKDRPFCTIVLKNKSEFEIGQFLQYKMFEIVYLGYLFGINPFDQPNVEFYKNETKAILSGNNK